MKQKLKKIPKKVGTKIRSKVIATLLRMRHRAITCKNQILINNFFHDHFDLDYTRHEDVRTVVETMMTARRTHRNRMHAYFKKFPSKEAALLKPHLIPQKNSGRSYAICSPAKHLWYVITKTVA
ncbi:hypothetical protein CJ030_MR4G022849 [Morella rubra]|uniref:Uncharacterized protein n=1 Tax=Morella rubra TaxID=262757 RepID=A0A6A1VV73_9ROSI|nr:hypothetical protein CJ030_MR4G022849 [Morella rubra]